MCLVIKCKNNIELQENISEDTKKYKNDARKTCSNKIHLQLYNDVINKTNKIQYLGINIQNYLTWNKQIKIYIKL